MGDRRDDRSVYIGERYRTINYSVSYGAGISLGARLDRIALFRVGPGPEQTWGRGRLRISSFGLQQDPDPTAYYSFRMLQHYTNIITTTSAEIIVCGLKSWQENSRVVYSCDRSN